MTFGALQLDRRIRDPLRHSMIVRILLLCALTVALPCAAQDATPRLERVTWPLMDFVVLGDSIHGTQVIVSPNLKSIQGRARASHMTLAVEPGVARRWAAGVAAVAESVAAMPRGDRTPFHTVPLLANRGRTRLIVSMDRDAPRSTPFALMLVDSVKETGWSVQASLKHLRSLLIALDAIAAESGLDSLAQGVGGTPFRECDLDQAPEFPKRFTLRYPALALRDREEGRVLAKYVVDSSGAVLGDSVSILLSDGPGFSQSVRRALPGATFVPGRRNGQPVRTVVWQWFVFKVRRD